MPRSSGAGKRGTAGDRPVVVIVALAVALWLTGHLATDAVVWAIAAAILIVIWRRSRRAS